MKSSIVKGLEALQRSEIEKEYQGSQMLRRRLVELIKERQELSLKKRRSDKMYESPNWSLLQADSVGYERALDEIISLISS